MLHSSKFTQNSNKSNYCLLSLKRVRDQKQLRISMNFVRIKEIELSIVQRSSAAFCAPEFLRSGEIFRATSGNGANASKPLHSGPSLHRRQQDTGLTTEWFYFPVIYLFPGDVFKGYFSSAETRHVMTHECVN